jgi:BirA family biotin operon repressor/biotin-[acetyl-CoA-carboxylase] ligase
VEVYDELPSTNTAVTERAAGGAPQWLVIAADSQSAGKGRQGRRFLAPGKTGAYFSVLLRPGAGMAAPQMITAAAAVAVAESIEANSGARAGIKWVNDVFCGGGKVCGILTEGAFDMESGGLSYAALGIGVNVTEPDGGFGDGAGAAGAVFDRGCAPADIRNRLIADILTRFAEYYSGPDAGGFLRAYRERSTVVGRAIDVISGGSSRRALALGIDGACRLEVRYEDGSTEALAAGEVRICV